MTALTKSGRQSEFTQDLADQICERMANGESLRQVCRDAPMPHRRTVFRWIDDQPKFAHQYARAREALQEHWADEILDIADEGSNDFMDRKNDSGETIDRVVDHEHISRSRLRVDTRKWLLSKLAPKKYGEKVDVNLGGQDGNNPVQLEDVRASNLASIEQIATRFPSATTGETSSDSKDTVSQDADAGADKKL